jgi:hypothetical protein
MSPSSEKKKSIQPGVEFWRRAGKVGMGISWCLGIKGILAWITRSFFGENGAGAGKRNGSHGETRVLRNHGLHGLERIKGYCKWKFRRE